MSTTRTLPEHHKLQLQNHFGFTKMPFSKNIRPTNAFDSRSQRDLFSGLCLWLQVKGLALVTGQSGVGKSLTIRRFVTSLDDSRYRVLHHSVCPSTPSGFLRAVNRLRGPAAWHLRRRTRYHPNHPACWLTRLRLRLRLRVGRLGLSGP